MRKETFLKIVISFVLLFPILNTLHVDAADHKLENIHIHVDIHEDGSATITEKRQATLSEGTENYIVIGNLGKSTIKDFVVTEDDVTYEFVDPWDIDKSLEEKAFKNGIIKERNHYELSWGIGSYGEHHYVVQYTITDFIKQLDDSQILFWRFVNDQTNIPPEKVTVEIEADKELSKDSEKIWGFGFEGDIQFVDGKVVAKSERPLTRSEYVTILVKFADGQFGTTDVLNKSFEEVQDQAFEGSDYGKEEEEKSSLFSTIFEFIKSFFVVIFFLGIFLFSRFSKSSNRFKKKRFRRQFQGEYYRDIPYDGQITDPYYFLYNMGATDFENILSAFILKWLKEDRITVTTEEKGFIKKRDVAIIHIINKEMEKGSLESQLFSMFVRAADKDGKLDQDRFSKSVSKRRSAYNNWESNVRNQSLRLMKQTHYVDEYSERVLFFQRTVKKTTEKGKELENNFYKFINYLYDFSLLNEHEPVNVKIWDDLMIWAAVLGLTDVVYDQFSQLYPQYETESLYSPVIISAVRSYSHEASAARVEPSRSRSSGGGGSTSIGGGGGSFGGGSGGGTR